MLSITIIRLGADEALGSYMVERPLSVGRHVTADIKLKDRSISRLHCLIIPLTDGRLKIRDLNSETGTIVKKKRISEITLSAKNRFFLGKSYRIDIKQTASKLTFKDQPTSRDEDSEDTNF